jgi:putative ABC transport system permease protein
MTFPSETPRWRRYLRFWRRDVRADIDDELAFHFRARIDELTEHGLAPDEARARALEEFGDVNVVRTDLQAIDRRMERRDRRAEWLDGWRQDLVYSARSLRRTPGVTLTIVLTLALGLGANAAMFTLLNAVFLRPPGGVAQPFQLRRVWTEMDFRSGRQFWSGYDYPQYEAVRKAVTGLGTTTLYSYPSDAKVRRGRATTQAVKVYAPSSYFPVLGVRPALGRFFTADEDRLGAGQHVVVASHAYWRRALEGDSAVIGETIHIDGIPHTLIGVADDRFSGAELTATELWVPLSTITGYADKPWWTDYNVNGFQVLIRARDGVPDAALDARLTLAMRDASIGVSAAPPTLVTRVGSIITARGPGKRAQEVQIATRLGGVALVVLLIACANVVSLLLARAVRRRREIGMRLALGISRGRLARLILTESVLLAALAGIGAVLAAFWGGLALRTLLLPDIHWAESPIDWRVLAGAVATSLAAGVAAGIVPAAQSGSMELTTVLKTGARDGYGRRSRLRSVLVLAQVALSVMLLVGAVLFVRSLSNVRALDLGFDASRLMFARVEFESPEPRRDSLSPARLAEAADRLRSAPGVQATALTAMRPLSGFSIESFYPEADTIAHKKPMGMYWAVSPDYFAAAGTRIVAGSGFPNAVGAATPPSVIVNTAMADALWPGESPLGRCVRFEKPDARCNTIIGVVETARWGRVIEEATPQFYLPLANMPFRARARTIAVRADAAMAPAVIRDVHQVLSELFPGGEPVIRRMSDVLEPHYRPWRLGATLFSLFGILAGIVAALGVYSTVSYNVSQRTHEFGVRMALGAQIGHVVRHVLGEGLRTVVLGVVVGVGLSLAAGRLVSALLYGVTPRDPVALTVVAALLLGVATAAALVPAWRASRVDPLTALRAD